MKKLKGYREDITTSDWYNNSDFPNARSHNTCAYRAYAKVIREADYLARNGYGSCNLLQDATLALLSACHSNLAQSDRPQRDYAVIGAIMQSDTPVCDLICQGRLTGAKPVATNLCYNNKTFKRLDSWRDVYAEPFGANAKPTKFPLESAEKLLKVITSLTDFRNAQIA